MPSNPVASTSLIGCTKKKVLYWWVNTYIKQCITAALCVGVRLRRQNVSRI
jgi:hypothetical protein